MKERVTYSSGSPALLCQRGYMDITRKNLDFWEIPDIAFVKHVENSNLSTEIQTWLTRHQLGTSSTGN